MMTTAVFGRRRCRKQKMKYYVRRKYTFKLFIIIIIIIISLYNSTYHSVACSRRNTVGRSSRTT